MRAFHVSQAAIERAGSFRAWAMTASAMALVLALSGCGTVDDALFGGDDTQAAAPAPAATAEAPASSQGLPGTLPDNGAVAMSDTGAAAADSVPGTAGIITAVHIEAGSDTGTSVSHTVAALRNDLSGMQTKILAAAGRLNQLEGSNASFASTYFQGKAQMTTRLQVGTTRGNPELVQRWNAAQTALDSLTGNINAMSNLGTEIADISSRAHYIQNTVQATYNVSGAVDEDHRQLDVLDDEANQTIVIVDRLLKQVSGDIQRQTAYVANERSGLTTLASAIKTGELYGAGLGGAVAAGPAPVAGVPIGGTALVTIRFDHAKVEYKQILYAALDQALQARPQATFSVVAVSPTRGSAPAVQLAQSEAERHAQEVLRTMSDMGVPGTRMSVSSITDPNVKNSEVRVYVR